MKLMKDKKYKPTDQIEITAIMLFNTLQAATNITDDAFDEILEGLGKLDGEFNTDRIVREVDKTIRQVIKNHTYIKVL